MTKEDIVSVIVRLFAVALVVYAIGRLPSLAAYLHQNQPDDSSYLLLFAISGLLVFFAAFLWKFSLFIARRLLSNTKGDVSSAMWTTEDVLETGFVLLGVYLAFGVLSDLLYWLFVWILAGNFKGQELSLEAAQWAQIYAAIIELFIVIGLIFGARGLVNVIRMLRYAGQEK